jgi:2-oxo-hept-3-ene-1,7-dioate hydratase/2-keto-4-pentenoate hydratase
MSLDQATCTDIADSLREAHRTGTPIPRLTATYPDMDVEDAYRVQEIFIARRLSEGARIKGYKVGLTSKPMQEMAGASEPDFSAMTDDMFLPESTPIESARLIRPLIEMEIAFVIGSTLGGPGVLPADVVRATDFVLPAIEIVDFRVELGPGFGIVDTIADLAACGAAVLGANPRRLDQIDIRRVRGTLSRNGTVEQEGESSSVLGNPVTAVAWLANKLAEFGVAFSPGDVILTGSFIRAVPVSAGDEIICEFDHGLGRVDVSFT